MSNVVPGLEPAASKALASFLSRPRVPTAFTEAQQALLLGFSWHRGPEKRCTRSDAGAEVPLLMRCIFSGKVLLPSSPALQDSHRGVGGNIGRGRDRVVVGCTRVFGKVGLGLWACGAVG